MPDDKFSLFRCASLALFGYQSSFPEIRLKVIRHITDNWKNFRELARAPYSEQESIGIFYDRRIFQYSLGEVAEIMAISEVYDCPVTVFTGTNETTFIGQGRPGKEIHLLTKLSQKGVHYDLLVPKFAPAKRQYSYAMAALGNIPSAKLKPPWHSVGPRVLGLQSRVRSTR